MTTYHDPLCNHLTSLVTSALGEPSTYICMWMYERGRHARVSAVYMSDVNVWYQCAATDSWVRVRSHANIEKANLEKANMEKANLRYV